VTGGIEKSFYSSQTTKSTRSHRRIEVLEVSVSNVKSNKDEADRNGILHTIRGTDLGTRKKSNDVWETTSMKKNNNDSCMYTQVQTIPNKFVSLLLPAQYPKSVAKGYFRFVSFCFTASIAGSAAMVLSTQTLLLAVGIVGQNSSGIMAGALNWVMKDFMGQLGGIVFASQMGKTKAFDNDPKRWRMVAAIALDVSTLLEILSPLCHQNMVLPIASIANVGKNIGFLTASASRAALHQSLAITGNLGDVTVKAGSQSMVASLVGTSLGIGLSTFLLHDTFNFGVCFVCLSAIHQGCTYLSLQNVPLAHFNRHRLHLAMEIYMRSQTMPTPADVAKKEGFFPLVATDSSSEWLKIGRPLREVCPSPTDLENSLAFTPDESYLIRFNERARNIDLVYFRDANEQDLYRGIYHACLIRHKTNQMLFDGTSATKVTSTVCADRTTTRQQLYNHDVTAEDITRQTHIQLQKQFPHIFEQFHAQGWITSSEVTDVEDSHAHRIRINIDQ